MPGMAGAAQEQAGGELVSQRVDKLLDGLKSKKTFPASCKGLIELAEKEPASASTDAALLNAGRRLFTVMQARFSNPAFWQKGLEFFLVLEFRLDSVAREAEAEARSTVQAWVAAAMKEVDEEARELAEKQKRQLKLLEEKRHSQGLFSDAHTPVTEAELAAAAGYILVESEDRRPAMSRDSRHELRLVTVVEEGEVCAVCLELMPVGSKAKQLPCKHFYHDECLSGWVEKANSCPMCRSSDLPSDTAAQRAEEMARRVQQSQPGTTGVYT